MTEREFAIPIRDLDAAGKPLRFPVRAAWLRGALEATEVTAADQDGDLDLRISKSGADVVVRGKLQAALVVPCARCLDPARIPVDADISVLAVPASAVREKPGKAGDDEDDAPEHADVIPFDGETLVLDDLVRDELLLAIPMIPLCSEACPGIRPELAPAEPERSPGVDPRLRPLLRLKKSST